MQKKTTKGSEANKLLLDRRSLSELTAFTKHERYEQWGNHDDIFGPEECSHEVFPATKCGHTIERAESSPRTWTNSSSAHTLTTLSYMVSLPVVNGLPTGDRHSLSWAEQSSGCASRPSRDKQHCEDRVACFTPIMNDTGVTRRKSGNGCHKGRIQDWDGHPLDPFDLSRSLSVSQVTVVFIFLERKRSSLTPQASSIAPMFRLARRFRPGASPHTPHSKPHQLISHQNRDPRHHDKDTGHVHPSGTRRKDSIPCLFSSPSPWPFPPREAPSPLPLRSTSLTIGFTRTPASWPRLRRRRRRGCRYFRVRWPQLLQALIDHACGRSYGLLVTGRNSTQRRQSCLAAVVVMIRIRLGPQRTSEK